jgi:hypothetical protein
MRSRMRCFTRRRSLPQSSTPVSDLHLSNETDKHVEEKLKTVIVHCSIALRELRMTFSPIH